MYPETAIARHRPSDGVAVARAGAAPPWFGGQECPHLLSGRIK